MGLKQVYRDVVQGCRWYILLAAQLTYELVTGSWTPETFIQYTVNGLNLYEPIAKEIGVISDDF